MNDPQLESWERGERRRTIYGAVLLAVLVILTVVVSCLAVILVRRSPVIARIDRSEQESRCVDRLEATFLGSVGELLDRRTETPERQAQLMERVRLTTAALTALAEDVNADPCDIPLPPPLPEETP